MQTMFYLSSSARSEFWKSKTPFSVIFAPLLLGLVSAIAAGDEVEFDAPQVVAARRIDSPESPSSRPGEHRFEASIHVSTLVPKDKEDHLIELLFRLEQPEQAISIVDYAPRTTVGSNIVGNVSVEKKNEATKSAGLTITGSFEHLLKATGAADIGKKNSEAVRFEKKPDTNVVTASGTIARATGAYFKFRPSPGDALVGGKDIRIVFYAPSDWQNLTFVLNCEAIGHRKSLPFLKSKQSSRRRMNLTLYNLAQPAALKRAKRVVQLERQLRYELSTSPKSNACIAQGLAGRFGLPLGSPVISPQKGTDYTVVLFAPNSPRGKKLARRLPEEARAAAEAYARSRITTQKW